MGYPQGLPPVAAWAQQRGWRVAWGVPAEVLDQLPGPPFHAFRRRSVPVVLAGWFQGMPALAVQVDFTSKRSRSTGSSYSAGTGSFVGTSQTSEKAVITGAVVLEMPSPVPELVLDEDRDVLDDVLDLFSFNRSRDVFQGKPVDIGPASLGIYHAAGASPEYVRAVLAPQRIQWLYGNGLGPSPATNLGPVRFRLSGRKLIVWAGRTFDQPVVLDALLTTALEILRWIPPAALRDPAAAEADRQHVPLSHLRIAFAQ
ncbi:hypothetical protein GCM10011581_33650 [Saccharopolyspora subtropica]|uniref:Uncharacterized protein n=1 Tax=Saccharopolyspora thermophila TaxID=89367 RepID=A0A917NET7_9PSEU|nr:hypothetical protein [Saccharopolyspora subtropica]GGI93780.1 hypothetical protein GCM10011581_33650 [Saccharopolyspora subtropica]